MAANERAPDVTSDGVDPEGEGGRAKSSAPLSLLTVACVCVGPAYEDRYVLILRDMVRRYLPIDHRFVCLSDRQIEGVECVAVEHRGWWSKIELFKPGRFQSRVLYLDLDVAVVGPLEDLAAEPGIVKDWHLPGFNSSVMCWDAGTRDHLYTDWSPAVMARLPGDQDWITEQAPDWPTFRPRWCVSYRTHCMTRLPDDARIVCFHGKPKPHEVLSGWVPEVWRVGGDWVPPRSTAANMEIDAFHANMRANCARPDLTWLDFDDFAPNRATLHIVGGGPSLDREALRKLRALNRRKHTIVACNGAIGWLTQRGVVPDFGIIMDGRGFNRRFLDGVSKETVLLLCSTCDPDLVNAVPASQVLLWHAEMSDPAGEGIILQARPQKPGGRIGGHSSVGLRAVPVGIVLGFRRFRLWGMPSSLSVDGRWTFSPDEPGLPEICAKLGQDKGLHHAYAQPENDGRNVVMMKVPGLGGLLYPTHGWMQRQADEFGALFWDCANVGVAIEAEGPGLLPDLCRSYNERRSRNARSALVPAA